MARPLPPRPEPPPPPGFPRPAGSGAGRLRLLLCRLSPEAEVRLSVTQRALFWAARTVPGVEVDLAFRPAADELRRRERSGRPAWTGIAGGEGPRAFDLLGVTLTVPQEAFNLPRLLHASGVPPAPAARLADPAVPLVILGGHSAAVAPFLLGPVPGLDGTPAGLGLVDAVIAGDGLGSLRELLALRLAHRDEPKPEFLARLVREVPGVLAPSLRRADDPPVPRRNDPASAWDGYDGGYLPWSDEAGEETLPVAFGCPHRCRFCRDGWASGPHRQTDPDRVLELARRMKASLAATDLNLLAADLGCQRGLPELLARLLALYPRLSAKSLAGISLVRSPGLAALFPRLGKRELTVGVEGLSDRLRRYLGKRFDAWALPAILQPMARAGLRQVKLFFIATGLETEADEAELTDLLGRIRTACPRLRLLVSLMPLFPAPGTPLESAPVARELDTVLDRIGRLARGAGAECRTSADAAEIRVTALLTRAGPAATPALVKASLEDGVLYDGGLARADTARVLRRLREAGLDLDALAAELPPTAEPPWRVFDLGTPPAALRREYQRSLEALAQVTGPCAEPAAEARRAAPPPRGDWAELPDPFARPRAAVLWLQVAREASGAPALTLARGALREWFRRDGAAAEAYAGLREVNGPPGAGGWRAAQIDFARSFRPTLAPAAAALALDPAGGVPAVPRFLGAAPGERPAYQLEASGASFEAAREAVAALRPPVKHRVDRIDGARRLVVERSYRSRSGLIALRETETGLVLLLAGEDSVVLERIAEGSPGGLETLRVLEGEESEACPRCGSRCRRSAVPADGARICPQCVAVVTSGSAVPR